MIVYHADTFGQLREGQILTLKPARTPVYYLYTNGVSSYGERAFLQSQNASQQAMQIIDFFFDYVRCLRFPDKPSRFTSVFASASLEDSKAWLAEISQGCAADIYGSPEPSTSGTPIYAVECSKVYIADAHFLDCESAPQDTHFSLPSLLPYALAYWKSVQEVVDIARLGSMRQTCRKPELLLVPPVRVVEKVLP